MNRKHTHYKEYVLTKTPTHPDQTQLLRDYLLPPPARIFNKFAKPFGWKIEKQIPPPVERISEEEIIFNSFMLKNRARNIYKRLTKDNHSEIYQEIFEMLYGENELGEYECYFLTEKAEILYDAKTIIELEEITLNDIEKFDIYTNGYYRFNFFYNEKIGQTDFRATSINRPNALAT
ncbi:hypothetical protein NO2_0818 [Candidatus Termititenax persephonae]|uniref:Uncharacterized protein n=1 Tax=Candidatus Termititenax persephonae TaxID=2218525 RepID=A0A388TGK0_9BACT|nr:hypothetical protein NO2_0818 [Candidatus Termititenax persephonae]